jgi:hypothetical protein
LIVKRIFCRFFSFFEIPIFPIFEGNFGFGDGNWRFWKGLKRTPALGTKHVELPDMGGRLIHQGRHEFALRSGCMLKGECEAYLVGENLGQDDG